jgi:hypothetical protein
MRARVTLSPGRSRPAAALPGSPPVSRCAALNAALTASGQPPLLATYEVTQGGPGGRAFMAAVLEAGHTEMSGGGWPCEISSLNEEPLAKLARRIFGDGDDEAVYRFADGSLVYVQLHWGTCYLRVAGPSQGAVATAAARFQVLYPATYLSAVAGERVPITFWSHGPNGPVQRLRMIDASPWETIERNYSAAVRDQLASMMDGFKPGKGGQLILWQGEPGTGKTWALRALVSEWLPWAEFHYITDPDAFFVDYPSYMVDVLLADSYEAIDPSSGEWAVEEAADGKWRVLILEDTGELLSANAKEKYGQGLSRLLNVVDGMIGQGLKVLCLVTTNDELGELNAAVRRPGRCAAQIEFVPMTAEEVAAWRGISLEEAEAITLAELYAGEGREALEPEPEPDAITAAASQPILAELARVAQAHAPEGGYGETAWNEETGTVFWVAADWTSNDEWDAAQEAFLAVEGVNRFESEAEAALPEDDGWQLVWPEPESEAAIARLTELAGRPL